MQGPIWISYWPHITSPLVPDTVRPAMRHLNIKASENDLPNEFSPPTEQYYGPCGLGYPLAGKPSGQGLVPERDMMQYSCSIPNQGFSSFFSAKILSA